MKFFFSFLFFVCGYSAYSQNIIVHEDLLRQLQKNSAYQTGAHSIYDSSLSSVQKSKQAVTEAKTTLLYVQDKIYTNLTNVNSGIKNVKTVEYITKYTADILNNMSKAATLSAGHPYLMQIEFKYADVIYTRLASLTEYVKNVIMKSDENDLMHPTDRDAFLYKVYREILVLNAMTENLCHNLQVWTLQDAVKHIVPYDRYLNQDKMAITRIMANLKF